MSHYYRSLVLGGIEAQSVVWRIAALGFVLALSACVTGGRTVSTENIELSYEGISEAQADAVLNRAEKALADVSTFLKRSPKRRPLIVIRDWKETARAIAVFHKQRIEIPASRLNRGRPDTGMVHEITHLVSGPPFLGSSLFSEGLATYMHNRFSAPDEAAAAENRDLHRTVKQQFLQKGRLKSLSVLLVDGHAFSNRQAGSSARVGRVGAYFAAGSLVKYLVERHGIERFMRAYYFAPVEDVYGLTFDELETEWLEFLKNYKT